MIRTSESGRNSYIRFPAPSEPEAEWRLDLPPFMGYADGWSGSVDEFLIQVRNGNISLQCVPLVAVVDQYTARINSLDLDGAGELIHIAASLIHYKSKLLLPPSDPAIESTGEDLYSEILNEITAGQHERQKARNSRTRSPEQDKAPVTPADLSLLDLFVLLNEVEQLLLDNSSYLIANPPVTVTEQLRWLWDWLSHSGAPIETANGLLQFHESDQAKICLFLALLEMVKRGQIRLTQDEAFSPISIHPVMEQSANPSLDQ